MSDSIDIVLLWVDGQDPDWLSCLEKFNGAEDGDFSASRYRDWGTLKYMFRSFEKFIPWVRKIHFVTWGHVPDWLNSDHPKVEIVFHEDFLEKDNLPVFNSHAIECNIHKIKGLSDRFIYFNDDTFILSEMKPTDFFVGYAPRDLFALNIISTDITAHNKINDLHVLSKYFCKKKYFLKYYRKIFRCECGIELIKTFLLLPWPQFSGFYSHHMPQPYLRSTFEKIWKLEPEILRKTSASRFRNDRDVNQYLFKWWNLLEGNFIPRTFRKSKKISLWRFSDALSASRLLISRRLEMVCLNDHLIDGSFDSSRQVLIDAFDEILPKKSSFER